MERVTGIGGVFFKAKDPQKTMAWYREHLGIECQHGCAVFAWSEANRPEAKGMTVWTPFASDTKYFEPSQAPFMINYRVENLDRMLAQLRALGAQVDPRVEDSEFGRFGWVMDPDGNRIELWQPPP